MTRTALLLPLLPLALLSTLPLVGCGGASTARPDGARAVTAGAPEAEPKTEAVERATAPAPAAPVEADEAPEPLAVGRPVEGVARGGGGPAPAAVRPAQAVRFETTVFETTAGGAPAERLIPADVGGRAQFWPGNAGDVIERSIGEITHLLSGDAISSGWRIGDVGALEKADQIALRVIAVEAAPEKTIAGTETARFATTPIDASKLSDGGKWYRVRFFPGGVWKEAQLQGYLRLDEQGPQWFRVDGLIRGLYGPQTRDYQKGDLFELRAVDRPTGVKLYPLG